MAKSQSAWVYGLPDANIADVMAVTFRNSMLGMLEMLLEAAYPGGHMSGNALKVAAEMESKWMAFGVPQKGLAFIDVDEFLGTVWGMSMAEKNYKSPADSNRVASRIPNKAVEV